MTTQNDKDKLLLYIAEKPELARAIVEGLGGGERKKGYYVCGVDQVTWCVGHLLQLLDPEDYDATHKNWRLEQLPIFPVPWKKKPIPGTREQLNIILALLKKSDTVVNASDPDPEGQLLVDEVLEYAGFNGKVKRLLINDLNIQVVKKALVNLRDNTEFAGLSKAAEARQIGDYLYGINMTRLYTLAARKEGYSGMVSVGRVQTPVLGMVIRRERENSAFVKNTYQTVHGVFQFGDCEITARYTPMPNDPKDVEGRLNDKKHVASIAEAMRNAAAIVKSIDGKHCAQPPPLPYNLLKLQADASRLYGFLPDRVKEITQSLREKHRLITYNRSDSQYLSDEQHGDAPGVLEAIGKNLTELTELTKRADPNVKSRAFNSGKVTAHHAIIPTQGTVDATALSNDEKSIYELVARRYVLQFLPAYQYDTHTITIESGGREFTESMSVVASSGWKDGYDNDETETEEEKRTKKIDFVQGQKGICREACHAEKTTTPKPLYTMASFLENLAAVANDIKDPHLRQTMLDKDKGKEGERGGIGTPATRDEIIKVLFERGFIEMRKKGKSQHIVSSSLGRKIYDLLPDTAKYPDMTAQWHEQQLAIENNELAIEEFTDKLIAYIGGEVLRVVDNGLNLAIEKSPCPECGSVLIRKKIGNTHFWGCYTYPECQVYFPDANGKPRQKAHKTSKDTDLSCPDCGNRLRRITTGDNEFFGCSQYPKCRKTFSIRDGQPVFDNEKPIVSEIYQCGKCGGGLVKRLGRKLDSAFWGCSNYPECKQTYPDNDNKPNFTTTNKNKKKKGEK